ncbi:uncharacterized protein A4U43_C04F11400 [Asparagus officinalis]|uniref:Uncharacterized protein n=1 Tax=Asparagus officinalis TaxID=4686 RepID=A0A5P1F016_ASPOF|nr:uncharacterized protein A4U43_C04F11400 [Asparagus officinalis]
MNPRQSTRLKRAEEQSAAAMGAAVVTPFALTLDGVAQKHRVERRAKAQQAFLPVRAIVVVVVVWLREENERRGVSAVGYFTKCNQTSDTHEHRGRSRRRGGRCGGEVVVGQPKAELGLEQPKGRGRSWTELGLASEMEEVELLGIGQRSCGFSGVW